MVISMAFNATFIPQVLAFVVTFSCHVLPGGESATFLLASVATMLILRTPLRMRRLEALFKGVSTQLLLMFVKHLVKTRGYHAPVTNGHMANGRKLP
jgi:hypothetical protein